MTRRRPPPSGSGRFAFATAGSLSYVARAATWQVRTRDPERAEVMAYQDGVWLGRAIVPVDAIAPGEAPPEWNQGPWTVSGQAG